MLVETLLNGINPIRLKSEKNRSDKSFNIFTILRKPHDEEHLHSAFLYEMLNTEGSHLMGNLFLKIFLKKLNLNADKSSQFSIFKESMKIDLFLTSPEMAIVIENKIWACDQDLQLERYYLKAQLQGFHNIFLVYLTLDGKKPSKKSLGSLDLKEVKCISYRDFIKDWIDLCILECANRSNLTEVFKQYKNLITQLSMDQKEIEQRLELMNFLGQNDNAINAQFLVNNWIHMKWHTEFEFWNALNSKVSEVSDFEVIECKKYSIEAIDKSVHSSRNRNLSYGLMINTGLAQIESDKDLVIYIERGGYILTIGLCVLHKDQPYYQTIESEELKQMVSPKIFQNSAEEFWLGWEHISRKINFESFQDEDTLRLMNLEFRDIVVDELIATIKEKNHQIEKLILT
ncbi:PDDEXK-like family protein [Leeuwenhoekiella nanhaiensis]|uniref:PD-(D/E)XK nuclease superfamily protein n=1 Tax=Leeuwenhoekiella nanhaiensis TaxID=1655491 RepID=A0A2G1VM02_9FLAO|nr:PD-(D/E)XK nuclease family protein [Leeuwenhoekiella nanhaiensis]PHQ27795.1 hypothetical protein CJ305_18235 [Leeuwenhoekiella nanhaiensis]